jgi:AraC-like DNA-binding protein
MAKPPPTHARRRNISDWRVKRVFDLMACSLEHCSSPPPSVRELAAEVHLSKFRLEHRFKEQTGLTIKQCFKGLALRKAARLLSNSLLSIKAISIECLYKWPVNLTEDFKKWFGKTPSEYRVAHFTKKRSTFY